MEGEKVRLTVMGLSYNPIREGAYALILAEVNGPYRIPIVIGAAEAQAIAVTLEHVVTPRPLTHDLFTSLGHAFGISLKEVIINGFQDGVFTATMVFSNQQDETIQLDSRTSDAIAIALRMGANIYTTRRVLHETGFIIEKDGNGKGRATGHNSNGIRIEIEWTEDSSNEIPTENTFENIVGHTGLSLEQLEQKLKEAVDRDDFETAMEIKETIEKLKNKKQP